MTAIDSFCSLDHSSRCIIKMCLLVTWCQRKHWWKNFSNGEPKLRNFSSPLFHIRSATEVTAIHTLQMLFICCSIYSLRFPKMFEHFFTLSQSIGRKERQCSVMPWFDYCKLPWKNMPLADDHWQLTLIDRGRASINVLDIHLQRLECMYDTLHY